MIFSNYSVSQVYQKTFELLSAENDRGAVLLGGVLTESVLDDMLSKKLISLPKGKKNTFNYSNKIDLTYQLGMINVEMHALLHNLRGARNSFAHKIVSDITDETMTEQIDKIFSSTPELYQNFMANWIRNLKSALAKHNVDQTVIDSVEPGARARFNNFITIIISMLQQDSLKVTPVQSIE